VRKQEFLEEKANKREHENLFMQEERAIDFIQEKMNLFMERRGEISMSVYICV